RTRSPKSPRWSAARRGHPAGCSPRFARADQVMRLVALHPPRFAEGDGKEKTKPGRNNAPRERRNCLPAEPRIKSGGRRALFDIVNRTTGGHPGAMRTAGKMRCFVARMSGWAPLARLRASIARRRRAFRAYGRAMARARRLAGRSRRSERPSPDIAVAHAEKAFTSAFDDQTR